MTRRAVKAFDIYPYEVKLWSIEQLSLRDGRTPYNAPERVTRSRVGAPNPTTWRRKVSLC